MSCNILPVTICLDPTANDSLGFTDPESNGCSLAHMSKLVLIEQLSHVPLLITKGHAF